MYIQLFCEIRRVEVAAAAMAFVTRSTCISSIVLALRWRARPDAPSGLARCVLETRSSQPGDASNERNGGRGCCIGTLCMRLARLRTLTLDQSRLFDASTIPPIWNMRHL